jgi:chemotaxis protein CheC
MSTINYQFTEFEMDQLKEVVNIGASHASIALSKMVQQKIGLTVPEVNIDNLTTIIANINSANEKMLSIIVKISGDTRGVMLFLLPGDCGLRIAKMVNPASLNKTELTEDDFSTLKEVGNILAGSYLNALCKFLGMNIMQSVSEVSTEPLDKIINTQIDHAIQISDIVFAFKVSLNIAKENATTHLYLLVDPNFTEKILELTKQKLV